MKLRVGVDLERARDDVAAFADLAGWPLADWQAAALALEARTTVLVSGRQMGKSHSLALLAVWRAFREPGHRVLVVSAGEEASRRLLSTVRRLLAGSPSLTGSVVDEASSLVTLTNGSEVRSVPASEKQVRGWSVDTLIVDEAAEVSDDLLLGAAFPTTAARPTARVVLASTPLASDGAFYRNAMAGLAASDHVKTFTWKAQAAGGEQDAPWITREVIAHQEATLTSDRFRREYLCEWSAASDVLFPPGLLQRVAADVELPSLEALQGPAALLGGVDWGLTNDRSVCAAIARLPVGALNGRRPSEPVFAAWPLRVWQAGVPIHDVASEIAAAAVRWDVLTSETNGAGGPATQDLQRLFTRVYGSRGGDQGITYAAHTTAEGKAEVYFRLRTLAERGQLVLPRHERLLRELAALRVERRPSGSVGIAAVSGGHDDLPDAIYLAAGPYRRRPAWGCRLADAAHDPQSEAPIASRGETVETGGGLMVPRRPPLQSVFGQELTLPALAQPFDEPPPDGPRLWMDHRAAVEHYQRRALGPAGQPEHRAA